MAGAPGAFGLTSELDKGTRMAIGVVLLWISGALLFVAFMSGKINALTSGIGTGGEAQGPHDASELVSTLANDVQWYATAQSIGKGVGDLGGDTGTGSGSAAAGGSGGAAGGTSLLSKLFGGSKT